MSDSAVPRPDTKEPKGRTLARGYSGKADATACCIAQITASLRLSSEGVASSWRTWRVHQTRKEGESQ